MCLTMNFAKFPGTLLFTRQLRWVLLKVALKHLYVRIHGSTNIRTVRIKIRSIDVANFATAIPYYNCQRNFIILTLFISTNFVKTKKPKLIKV